MITKTIIFNFFKYKIALPFVKLPDGGWGCIMSDDEFQNLETTTEKIQSKIVGDVMKETKGRADINAVKSGVGNTINIGVDE